MTEQLCFAPPRDHVSEARRFLDDNPAFLAYLLMQARRYIEAGRRFSVKRIVEDARWDLRHLSGGKPYRINNSHTSTFADELVRRLPAAADLIERRGR